MSDETPEAGAPSRAPITLQVAHPEGASGLDYILIIGALGLVGYGLYGLMNGHVASDVLPIVASLLSFITGTILGGYAGYRWGASATQKKLAAGAAQ